MLSSIPEEIDHPTAMYNIHADGPTLAENSFAQRSMSNNDENDHMLSFNGAK